MKTIAQTLRQARKAKGYRLVDVAEFTDATYSAVARYETGTRRPDADYLRRVAPVLGLDPASLLAQASKEYGKADSKQTKEKYAKE